MTWRVLAASRPGTSHLCSGKACEDSCWADVDLDVEGAPVLSVFVADGAGSAARGGEAAEHAVAVASRFMAERLRVPGLQVTERLGRDCAEAARLALLGAAAAREDTPRDWACTFLAVISAERGTVVTQVGDGAVVLDVGQGLEVAVAPMGGEYANMTSFLTDDDALQVLTTRCWDVPASRVAAFTDGLQRLALNLAANTPHEPFFQSFFDVLAQCSEDQQEALQAALVQFLDSQSVNSRTDDDKTLALAQRMG